MDSPRLEAVIAIAGIVAVFLGFALYKLRHKLRCLCCAPADPSHIGRKETLAVAAHLFKAAGAEGGQAAGAWAHKELARLQLEAPAEQTICAVRPSGAGSGSSGGNTGSEEAPPQGEGSAASAASSSRALTWAEMGLTCSVESSSRLRRMSSVLRGLGGARLFSRDPSASAPPPALVLPEEALLPNPVASFRRSDSFSPGGRRQSRLSRAASFTDPPPRGVWAGSGVLPRSPASGGGTLHVAPSQQHLLPVEEPALGEDAQDASWA